MIIKNFYFIVFRLKNVIASIFGAKRFKNSSICILKVNLYWRIENCAFEKLAKMIQMTKGVQAVFGGDWRRTTVFLSLLELKLLRVKVCKNVFTVHRYGQYLLDSMGGVQ